MLLCQYYFGSSDDLSFKKRVYLSNYQCSGTYCCIEEMAYRGAVFSLVFKSCLATN